MENIFKDVFVGRIVESITNHTDEENKKCVQLTFVGTPRKLRLYSAETHTSVNVSSVTLTSVIWIDDDEVVNSLVNSINTKDNYE